MHTLRLLIASSALLYSALAGAQTEMAFLQGGGVAQSATESRQAELYNDGTTYMNDGKWEQAVGKFDEAAKLKGSRSAGALYWKAYALNKAGRRSEAIATVNELRKSYPQARWVKESEALMIEMGANSETGKPAVDQDEDLKLLALNRLMDHDEDRALPLLKKFLEGGSSLKLKERALFVLAQSNSPAARQLMGDIARGKVYPALQVKAIHNLGIESSDENMRTLSEIYSSSTDVAVKKKILDAFGIAGQTTRLLAAAKQETNPELQKQAIHGLGISGAHSELKELYKESASPDARIQILEAMMIAGSDDTLAEISQTEQDPRVRMKAIHTLGIAGGKKVGPTLVSIYNTNPDAETRRAVAEALFVGGDASALVDLAKKEKDPQMKRRLVEKISLMDEKAARDYMIQILEQE